MKRHTLEQQENFLSLSRKRSKAGVVLGLPMLVIGGAVSLLGISSFGAALSTGEIGPAVMGVMILCVGAGFFFVGAMGVFGRSGTNFDLSAQTVKQWKKVLMCSWDEVTSLEGFDSLTIDERLSRGRPRYSLSFTGESSLKVLDTRRGRDILELANKLSSMLTLPINNRSKMLDA